MVEKNRIKLIEQVVFQEADEIYLSVR